MYVCTCLSPSMSISLQIEENFLCKIPCIWVDVILHQEMYVKYSKNLVGGGIYYTISCVGELKFEINLTFIIIDKSI